LPGMHGVRVTESDEGLGSLFGGEDCDVATDAGFGGGVLECVGDGRWEDVCGETRYVKVEGCEVVGVGTKLLGSEV